MLRKLLIANRGEIAARVIATAKRMGIATVAVYSDADARALHVEMADEAVRIGPAPVTESYLNTQAILDAAKATGATAIHPGYGFLSENPDFVETIKAAGLTFVGPSADAIRAMGLKDAAKALMEKAGVPVVPGYHGSAQDADTLAAEATRIGYPILIKARAGGGGKGMRLVERAEDFADALAGAQREGQASFGDPNVLIEKYITTPRHIEIQVFADAHGNTVHMFERDCSLQRRHQKVIEEAPAPDMPAEVRQAMGQAAVEAARAIGYQGAGTVEFIADGSGPLRADGFWFMEMNTRLQVEHPVTEAITGLDLVELQLQVAAGAALPFEQDDLTITGHAFEARIYAEDAANDFLPATGHLDHLHFPLGAAFERAPLRIDAGVRQGDDVTPYYDPMIAKLIVHGPDRASALARLSRALERCQIAGVTTNTGFLARLAQHDGFAAGQVDTGLIGRDIDALGASHEPAVTQAALLVAAGLPNKTQSFDPWLNLTGWRPWGHATQQVQLLAEGAEIKAQIKILNDATFDIDGTQITATWQGDDLILTSNGTEHRFALQNARAHVTVFHAGDALRFEKTSALERGDSASVSSDQIVAPMPGLVAKVAAAVGQTVAENDSLMVLEAMKMEHTLRASRAGVVADVLAVEGDQVADGAVLVRLEPEDG